MPLRLQVTTSDDPQARTFRYEFDGDRAQIVLGRRGGVDVLLPHAKVSLVHARIDRRGGSYFLVDEGSTNGTLINGISAPPRERVLLRDRDRVLIGDFRIEVSVALTELDGPAENSGLIAKRMVREVLERLGPRGSQPHLVIVDGPQRGALLSLDDPGRTYILGRDPRDAGSLRLDDVDMWSDHAALERDDVGVTVRALGATQSLTVNRERVEGGKLLHDGDVVTLGPMSLRYTDPAELYLRRLQSHGEHEDTHTAPPRSPRRQRLEWSLLLLASVTAAAAAAGLVYVLLW
jgi:pSer/pThr/pTyr-binding forkhead associated (FHA) protein